MQGLRLPRDSLVCAETVTARLRSEACRRCAPFCCSGLVTLLEDAFQQVTHALIHAAIRPCSTDARRGSLMRVIRAPIAELRAPLIQCSCRGSCTPVVPWNDQVATVRCRLDG